MLPVSGTHSQVVLGVWKSYLNGVLWGTPAGEVLVFQGFLSLCELDKLTADTALVSGCWRFISWYSFLSWCAASPRKGPHFWQGVLSRRSPCLLLVQSRVLPADLPMAKCLEIRILWFALLEEFAIQLKRSSWWFVIWPWPGRLYKLQLLSECSFLENWGFVATVSLPCSDMLPV